MKIKRNLFSYFSYSEAYVLLIFVLLAFVVWIANVFFSGFTMKYFMTRPKISFGLLDIFRMFSWSLGHANLKHLFMNLAFLGLIGPPLEKKYGHGKMLVMIIVTSVIIAFMNIFLGRIFPSSSAYLLGTSGIVFMLIGLTPSLAETKGDGKITIWYLIVILMYGGMEVFSAMKADNASQFAHLAGGACGIMFVIIENLTDKANKTNGILSKGDSYEREKI